MVITNMKQKAVSGMIWKLAEKMSMQIIQFIIQIVLARLLLPEEYGLVGLLTIFITVSDVFIQQGFTAALIQRKEVDDTDYSSVFIVNIIMAVVIYGVLYVIAPYVAVFYRNEKLIALMRILALNVLFGALSAVHNAILSRNLDFKKSFYRNTFNVFTQGIVGISAALMGAGAWALVLSKISGTLVGTMVLWITVKWKPMLKFSIIRVKSLFNFSSKVLGTNLLNTVFNNIHSLIIGRYYTSADLGYYQRGQQMPQAFMTAIDGSFSEVLYPTLSALQDDKNAVKNALRRSMKTSMFIVLPMLMGVIATADALVDVLLTDKWLPCVPFMQLQCIICIFWPLSARTHALNAIGKSDVTFKLSLISKVITLVLIFVFIRHGILSIMLGTIFSSLISFWIASYFVNKYIEYSMKELFFDLMPCIGLSVFMMIVVHSIGWINIGTFAKLILQVVVGVTIYFLGAKLLKIDSMDYLLGIVKKFLKKE